MSLNGGSEWKRFMNGLPTVRIDDILVHPRDNDLILGTHGRSLYIMDDITALQQMTDTTTANADAVLFDIRPAVGWVTDVQKSILVEGAKFFRGQNPPQGSAISYWLKSSATGDVTITISDINGRDIRTLIGTKNAGLNRVQWDLRATGAAGRGRGQATAPGVPPAEAGAPAAQPPPAAPQQEAARGRGAAPASGTQAGGGGAGGGRGRGGFAGPMVAPGSYLVKVMVGDKLIGQKTVVVEPDTTFMQNW